MRFIKRLFFLIILIVLAFFIYRLISPKAANNLLLDVKTFSNDKIGTKFSLTGKTMIVTGTTTSITGDIMQDLFDEEDDPLLDATMFTGTSSIYSSTISVTSGTVTGTTSTSVPSSPTSPSSTTSTTTSSSKPTTTSPASSQQGLSSQDMRDLQKLLQNFSK